MFEVQSQGRSPRLRPSNLPGQRNFIKNTNDGYKVDGTIVIFDVETNEVARKLRGHTRQIQSIRFVYLHPSRTTS